MPPVVAKAAKIHMEIKNDANVPLVPVPELNGTNSNYGNLRGLTKLNSDDKVPPSLLKNKKFQKYYNDALEKGI